MRAFITAALFLWLTGCASYQNKVDAARESLRHGRYDEAAEAFGSLALQPGGDQLVYLLDWGLSLYLAERYEESIEAFTAADQLVDLNDYLSLSKETASLLLGQEMVQYKGTSYEKLLINVYLALNFLQLNQLESAAVEIRKLRLRLGQLSEQGEKDYNRSFLASYLSAVVWEMAGEWDSAVIDYETAYKLSPDVSLLRQDLLRATYRARRMERHRQLLEQWGVSFDPSQLKTHGQVVFLVHQGWVSRLRISSANYRLPELQRVPARTQRVELKLTSEADEEVQVSEVIFDLDDMAHQYMGDIIMPLLVKRLAGVAAKAVAADQVRQKNETLGALAWVAMNVSDRADLRQWSTLPETFQILRFTLKPGTYEVSTKSGEAQGALPQKITVEAGKIHFEDFRVF